MNQNNAIALISRIRENANSFLSRELEAMGITGIVPSHGDILFQLFSGNRFTMKELAAKIHRTKPTVTVLIDKLVDMGYVSKQKCATDHRVTYVELTKQGLALRPIFIAISERLNSIAYHGLSDNETIILEQVLQKIKQNFENIEIR